MTRRERLMIKLPMCRQSGVAAVEFAFMIIPLLLIVAGIVEFGRVFWYYDALTKTTRDGARLMSLADKDQLSTSINRTKSLVITAADNAHVSPPLADSNVLVQCLSTSFSVQPCVDGMVPANVRVTITGFNVVIGQWVPFLTLISSPWEVELAPSTTMRYMCSSSGSC